MGINTQEASIVLVLVIRAYMELVRYGSYIRRNDFTGLRTAVHQSRTNRICRAPDMQEKIFYAINVACTWHWRRVSCLQRSAATTSLLRRYGAPAQLVIATQHTPFKAHAWVEIDGQVVSDGREVQALYPVLDRF